MRIQRTVHPRFGMLRCATSEEIKEIKGLIPKIFGGNANDLDEKSFYVDHQFQRLLRRFPQSFDKALTNMMKKLLFVHPTIKRNIIYVLTEGIDANKATAAEELERENVLNSIRLIQAQNNLGIGPLIETKTKKVDEKSILQRLRIITPGPQRR